MASTTNNDNDDAANLSALLSALAAGARAVQSLPSNQDEWSFEASLPEVAHALQQAHATERAVVQGLLHEIAHASELEYEEYTGMSTTQLYEQCATACELLLEQVERYLQNDPAVMMINTSTHNHNNKTTQQLAQWSQQARQTSASAWNLMLQQTVSMEKPQITYQHQPGRHPPCNGRTQVFVPPFASNSPQLPGHGHDNPFGSLKPPKSYPPNIVAPSHHVPHLYQAQIHAFLQQTKQQQQQPQYIHPLAAAPTWTLPSATDISAIYVDTPELVQKHVVPLLQNAHCIAMDLEAHSYRTFAGMTCLLQMTIAPRTDSTTTTTNTNNNNNNNGHVNLLLDVLVLPPRLVHETLQPALADPRVLKVLHGGDSDIAWLQRDFGLYVVNLWDTGRAARAWNLTSYAYAHLLQTYCVPDSTTSNNHHNNPHQQLIRTLVQNKKRCQLADWRQRPLPDDLQQYAICDTHFLLYIAQQLYHQASSNNTVDTIVQASQDVCLIRYPGPPVFQPDGYQTLLRTNRKRSSHPKSNSTSTMTVCTPLQEACLKALWDWRDATARERDESWAYICPNSVLLKWAMTMPTETSVLPPHLKLPEPACERPALAVIRQVVQDWKGDTTGGGGGTDPNTTTTPVQQSNNTVDNKNDEDDMDEDLNAQDLNMNDGDDDEVMDDLPKKDEPVRAKSLAFFKPTDSRARQRRGMMSPVLGTEALYKQAGWMTPQEAALQSQKGEGKQGMSSESEMAVDDVATSEDNAGDGRRLVVGMDTSGGSTLDLKSKSPAGSPRRTKKVSDGLATSRVAREASKSPVLRNLEDESLQARRSSAQIRTELADSHHIKVLGLLTAATGANGEEEDDDQDPQSAASPSKAKSVTTEPEEFSIPRSMREIYKISNQNRRQKKAGSSPVPERGGTPTSEKELAELRKAEALLEERGMDAAGFLFTTNSPTNTERETTAKKRGGKKDGDEGGNSKSNTPTKQEQEDIAFFREAGWVPSDEPDSAILAERYGSGKIEPPTMPSYGFGYSAPPSLLAPAPPAGGLQQPASNNPFFSGAALQGGPLANSFKNDTSSRQGGKGGRKGGNHSSNNNNSRGNSNKNNNNSGSGGKSRGRQSAERPEKRDGRSHVYRRGA